MLQVVPKSLPKTELVPMQRNLVPFVFSLAEKEEHCEFFRRCPPLAAWKSEEHCLQLFGDALIIQQDGRPVGLIKLTEWDQYSKSICFGMVIDKDLVSKRSEVSEEACRQMLSYCFNYLGCLRVWTKILEHRTQMKDHMQSVGFKVEGLLRHSLQWKGQPVNEYLISILPKDSKWDNY